MLWKPYYSLYVRYYYVNVMNALDIYVDVIDSPRQLLFLRYL